MSETRLVKDCMKRASQLGARLFRNNVGTGWVGNIVTRATRVTRVTLAPGDVVVRQGRPLHSGLAKGSSDLIGWRPVVITSDMVGKTIAQFLSPEVKTPTGRMRKGQPEWLATVKKHGGCSGVVRSVEQLDELLESDLE